MKEKVLHMIGNAHLDPVWLWRWQEGFQETKATFRSALDRMKESEDFIFTSSSAASYEWIEKNDPTMFEEIRQRVKEGRWQIVGGWWTQPDCNIPSGESFVRQALYGQRYFYEKFGVTAKVGYNVDSFGHNGMLPQILKKCGMDYYVFMRPMPGEKSLPSRIFRWESDDGSQVLAFRILFEYLTWGKEVDVHVERCMGELKDPVDEMMVFYGVGNHGGGPTKENIESIRRLNEDPEYPTLIFSHPYEFFRRMEQKGLEFPVVHDDLQHHASGCYAVHSGIKRWNRKAENALLMAEKFSVAAKTMVGQSYPKDFDIAWKNVLFNQFHDTLAGTSIEAAYEDANYQYGESLSIAQRNANYALQAFSWAIDIEQDDNMRPIVVFNPNSWEVTANVEVELPSVTADSVLRDDEGQQIPWQSVQPEASCNGRTRVSFMAELPAFGWRVYKLYLKTEGERIDSPGLVSGDTFMENNWYRLTFNPATGCISSLFDKEKQTEVFRGEAAIPAVMKDDSDTWSHDVLHFNDRIGEFQPVRVFRAEHGSVKTIIRVESEYGSSRMIQDFTMYSCKKQIDVNVKIDWRGHHKLVKLLFPVNAVFNRNSYEIPYGFIEREGNGEEEPMQNWLDVSGMIPGQGKGYIAGVAILNDGKYSANVVKDTIGLTVLRSPIYAHHTPYVPSERLEYSYIDQGIQSFTYSILPHHGNWEDAGVAKAAWELNQRPEIIIETYHEGSLPQRISLAHTNKDNVLISVLKLSEDGRDIILRAYECCKKKTDVTIALTGLEREIRTTFNPCEIKTFRIPMDRDSEIYEIDMTEMK